MNNEAKNGYVRWTTFVVMISVFVGLLGIIWAKLEKIDDSMGQVKIDIAVIKQTIGIKNSTSILLNRFYENK